MSQLEVYRQGEKLFGISLEKNLVRLGRSAPSDIELPDPSLSREHCLLQKKEQTWFIDDISRNGIRDEAGSFLETRAPIKFNQRYQIGRIFSFQLVETRSNNGERTIVTSRTPTQLVNVDKARNTVTIGRACVRGKNERGEVFKREIQNDGLTIGAHNENDLQLVAEEVSRFHARIDLIENVYVFTDLSSTNGSFVNRTRVLKAPLHHAAKIFVGPFELTFEIEREEIALSPKHSCRFLNMVSQNKNMKTIFTTIEVIAPTEASIFIYGETGTGKELAARALHTLSQRDPFPFVAINCAALPKDLVESELFGHEKGAFTGASTTQIGAFEAAHQGTLFLDEVTELDLSIQAKLLRALETREIKRLGAARIIPVSLRILSASHKNLLDEVKLGNFREDLFYRLHVMQIELPALRDRLEDLPLLIADCLRQLKLDLSVASEAIEMLQTYSFPGNVRELKNILQRAAMEHEIQCLTKNLSPTKILAVEDFEFLKSLPSGLLTAEQVDERKKMTIELHRHDFVQVKAAKALGMAVSTLNDKIKRYGIHR
jgi:transcriptional regulator with GAF, ATPase, and Fis domain